MCVEVVPVPRDVMSQVGRVGVRYLRFGPEMPIDSVGRDYVKETTGQ